jgi:hypothetical protein
MMLCESVFDSPLLRRLPGMLAGLVMAAICTGKSGWQLGMLRQALTVTALKNSRAACYSFVPSVHQLSRLHSSKPLPMVSSSSLEERAAAAESRLAALEAIVLGEYNTSATMPVKCLAGRDAFICAADIVNNKDLHPGTVGQAVAGM